MDNKKILLVCASFYPVNSPRSFRATGLAKEFARQDHLVTVITPKTRGLHDEFEKNHNLTIKDLGRRKWKSVIVKGRGINRLIRRFLFRFPMLLFEYPNIELLWMVKKVLKYESGYDLLVSIAVPYPVHWGVAAIRSSSHPITKVWVADCGDPYVGDRTDSFRKPFYFKYIEKWFCRKTNYITVPIEAAKSAYFQEFHDKIRVIPQGFELGIIKIPDFKKIFDYPIFAYAGGFIPGKRDPKPFLSILSKCNKSFRFVIYTSHKNILIPYKKILGDKLEIREYIPREELLKALSAMDFLVNLDNNTNTQLPSKLIDYAITGRPVLNVTANFNTAVLTEFLDGNYNRKMKLECLDNYDIRLVAAKFIQLCS